MVGCSVCCGTMRENGPGCGTGIFSIVVIALAILSIMTTTIWYMVDWIRIASDGFNDGNGVGLEPW